jgi:hypothetical protein
MLVVLRTEAEHELLEAQAWYESKALGLVLSSPVPQTQQLRLRFAIPLGICASKKSSGVCCSVNFPIR